jgi:hypothetical protein
LLLFVFWYGCREEEASESEPRPLALLLENVFVILDHMAPPLIVAVSSSDGDES